jgi:hypothetical protein
MQNLDRMHKTLTAQAEETKQAKRAAKIERRRLRREQAAREAARALLPDPAPKILRRPPKPTTASPRPATT